MVESPVWQVTSPVVINLHYKCALGIICSAHLHNWARWMQCVFCLSGWGWLSGCSSQAPGLFLPRLVLHACAAPLPSTQKRVGRGGWVGQQLALQQEAPALRKQ